MSALGAPGRHHATRSYAGRGGARQGNVLLIGYQDGNRPEQVEEGSIMPPVCCADLQDLQVLNALQ